MVRSCKFSRKPIHLSLWTYTQNHGTCPKWWKLVVGCVDQYHSAFQQSILWASRGLVEWWPIVVLQVAEARTELCTQPTIGWNVGFYFKPILKNHKQQTTHRRKWVSCLASHGIGHSNSIQQQNNKATLFGAYPSLTAYTQLIPTL